MNILGFILGKKDSLEAVPASSFDFSNLPSFLEQEGAFVIYGTGREMNKFYRNASVVAQPDLFFIKKFAILTGEVDKLITALPIDSRKILNSSLTALCLAKRPPIVKKIIISVLRIFNLPTFYPSIFRKQFCLVIGKESETIFSFLSQGLNIPDIKLSLSIYKGSGKFIAPLFNSETGENIGYAKIYASEKDGERYGKTEARALRFLKQPPFKSAEVPRVLLSAYFGDNLVNAVSTKSGLKNFKGVSNKHIEWIKELAKETGAKKSFKDSSFATVIKEKMELIKNRISRDDFLVVNRFYEEAVEALNDKEFIFSFVNREFDCHELLHHKNKNLVIDWEHAREEFPPLFDVFSLLLSEGEGWLQDLEAIFFYKNKKSDRIIGEFLREWGISGENAYFMFLLFLFDRLSASSEKDTETILQFLKRARVTDCQLLFTNY